MRCRRPTSVLVSDFFTVVSYIYCLILPHSFYSRGTSIDQVYSAMESVYFSPIYIFPEKVKGGGGGSGDGDGTPSGDVTLGVSVVETYTDSSYGDYDTFLDNLFNAMSAVSAGSCMDDKDTDPHVSMARGVKFKSSDHSAGYYYAVNLEVAVWQAMYPNGVIIGSNNYASFPAGSRNNKQYVGYGNLYFFFDRANISKPKSSDEYGSTCRSNAIDCHWIGVGERACTVKRSSIACYTRSSCTCKHARACIRDTAICLYKR